MKMDTGKQSLKTDLRSRIQAHVKNLPAEKRKADSAKLCANLRQQTFFQKARSLLFFAPLPEEPDLWPLLNEILAGKSLVALPCFDADNRGYQPRRIRDIHVELMSSKFGIREPAPTCIAVPLADLDVVLVPGVAFNSLGHRLGRGRGYYDRLLENFAGNKIGIAFDEQMVEVIPVENNDVPMDWIITPTQTIRVEKEK